MSAPGWRRRVAGMAIAAGAVGVAVSTSGATWQASAADDEWQRASRLAGRTTGQTIEMVRYLYEAEARQAFDVTMIEVRADELEKQAAGSRPASEIRHEAAAARQAADELARSAERTRRMATANKLVADPRYRTANGGFDVVRRLHDLQREDWDPGAGIVTVVAAGDAAATRARWWTAGMVLSLLLPLVGMVLWLRAARTERPPATRRRRRPADRPRVAPGEPPDVGLGTPGPPGTLAVEDPPGTSHVVIVGIGLLLATLATLFTAAQLRADLEESEAFGAAGRHAAQVTAIAAGGGVREAFQLGATYQVALFAVQQGALLSTATAADDDSDVRLAEAGLVASDRLYGIAETMGARPGPDAGLAPEVGDVVSATRADAFDAVAEQQGSVTAADRAGGRSNTLVLALFTITVAALLLDVAAAATGRRSRRRLLGGAGCLAGAAVVIAVLATT